MTIALVNAETLFHAYKLCHNATSVPVASSCVRKGERQIVPTLFTVNKDDNIVYAYGIRSALHLLHNASLHENARMQTLVTSGRVALSRQPIR